MAVHVAGLLKMVMHAVLSLRNAFVNVQLHVNSTVSKNSRMFVPVAFRRDTGIS